MYILLFFEIIIKWNTSFNKVKYKLQRNYKKISWKICIPFFVEQTNHIASRWHLIGIDQVPPCSMIPIIFCLCIFSSNHWNYVSSKWQWKYSLTNTDSTWLVSFPYQFLLTEFIKAVLCLDLLCALLNHRTNLSVSCNWFRNHIITYRTKSWITSGKETGRVFVTERVSIRFEVLPDDAFSW